MKNIGMVLHGNVANDIRVLNEIRFLNTKGYRIFILTPAQDKKFEQTATENYVLVQASIGGKIKDFLFGLANLIPLFHWYWKSEIKSFAKANKIDILHAHDLYMGGPVAAAGQTLNIPVVLDLHENFPFAILDYQWTKHPLKRILSRPKVWMKKEGEILAAIDGVITLSDRYASDLKSRYGFLKEKEIAIYPNVPDVKQMLAFEKNTLDIKIKGFCVLYFGLISRRRGLHTASAAVKILNNEGHPCTMLAIGKVDSNEMDYFNKEVMNEHVLHVPWIDISELRSYIELAHVCASPLVKNEQHESGVANKIFQYMLYQKPLLVSDCAPQKAIVEAFSCGLSHTSEDPDSFAEKLKYMIENPKELAEMGLRGKKAVLENRNTVVMGENIHRLYQRLLSE